MGIERIDGLVIGLRHAPSGDVDGLVLHVARSCSATGPAENAYTFIDLSSGHPGRARYVSWVNLYDIEHAGRQEAGRWSLCEPQRPDAKEVEWYPYGWNGEMLPNVAHHASKNGAS